MKGLEIDPYDYKLRCLRAAVYLRSSPRTTAKKNEFLDEALVEVAELFSERSLSRHDGFFVFFYALAMQKQGIRLFNQADQTGQVESLETQEEKQAALELAAALREQAVEAFGDSNDLFEELLDRGEVERLTRYHMLITARILDQPERCYEHGEKYLEASAAQQELARLQIEGTTIYGYEVEKRKTLTNLQSEEVEIRSILAKKVRLSRKDAGGSRER